MPSVILNKWSEIVQTYKRYIIEGGEIPSLEEFYHSLNINRVNYLLKEFKGLLEETFLLEPYAQILYEPNLELIKSVFYLPPENHLSGIITYVIFVSNENEKNALGYSIAAWIAQSYPLRVLNPERKGRFILYNHTRGEIHVEEHRNLNEIFKRDYVTSALIFPDLEQYPLFIFVGRNAERLYMDFLYKEIPTRIEVSNKDNMNKFFNLPKMLENTYNKIAHDFRDEKQRERAQNVYEILIRGIAY